MHDGGRAWQGEVCGRGDMCGRYYEIRLMSGRYASYWNAFLLTLKMKFTCSSVNAFVQNKSGCSHESPCRNINGF